MRRAALLPLVLVLATACSSSTRRKVVLSPAAESVHIEMHAPANCAELGDVYGKFESTDQEQALLGAKIDMRNRAAVMGADHVVLETNNASARQDSFEGTTFGNLRHQIVLGGKALKCGAAPAAAAAPSSQPAKAGPGVSL